MEIGVFSVLFYGRNSEDALDYISESGLDMTEVGTSGSPGDKFYKSDELLESEDRRQALMKPVTDRGLQVNGFSCHNNPISPGPIEAEETDEILRGIIRLVNLLDVSIVNAFPGIAGSDDTAKKPSWPAAPWPTAYSEAYDYQWNEKLIPYWQDLAKFAREQDVRIVIELHAGSLVYTPRIMLKLREAINEYIGANLDLSHLWWQGTDPIAVIHILSQTNAIHHFHAKDTYINQENVDMYGLTDIRPYDNVVTRAWAFRTVGYRHSPYVWIDIISQLIINGYDYVLSIEHENPTMSVEEGFQKACQTLKSVNIYDKPADVWWA